MFRKKTVNNITSKTIRIILSSFTMSVVRGVNLYFKF